MVGGLVGRNEGELQFSYAAGTVVGVSNKGALVGSNIGGISTSYYDKDISGYTETNRGLPRTTLQMKTQSNFSTWNFTSIWSLSSGKYPTLRT